MAAVAMAPTRSDQRLHLSPPFPLLLNLPSASPKTLALLLPSQRRHHLSPSPLFSPPKPQAFHHGRAKSSTRTSPWMTSHTSELGNRTRASSAPRSSKGPGAGAAGNASAEHVFLVVKFVVDSVGRRRLPPFPEPVVLAYDPPKVSPTSGTPFPFLSLALGAAVVWSPRSDLRHRRRLVLKV